VSTRDEPDPPAVGGVPALAAINDRLVMEHLILVGEVIFVVWPQKPFSESCRSLVLLLPLGTFLPTLIWPDPRSPFSPVPFPLKGG